MEIRSHPAPDASSRLSRAFSIVLQAGDAEPPEGTETGEFRDPGRAEGIPRSRSGKSEEKDFDGKT